MAPQAPRPGQVWLGLNLAPRLSPFDLGLLPKSPLRTGLGWGLKLGLSLAPPRLGLGWGYAPGLGWGG